MHDDDTPTDSADQDAWLELARAVRVRLAGQVDLIPAMQPCEVQQFVETCRAALNLEIEAATRDKRIDVELGRLFAD